MQTHSTSVKKPQRHIPAFMTRASNKKWISHGYAWGPYIRANVRDQPCKSIVSVRVLAHLLKPTSTSPSGETGKPLCRVMWLRLTIQQERRERERGYSHRLPSPLHGRLQWTKTTPFGLRS